MSDKQILFNGPMPALSVRQPWAWLLVKGFKDIENRTWRTNFRGKFLIHASKGMTHYEYESCVDTCLNIRNTHPFPKGTRMPPLKELERGGIIGIAEITDCVDKSNSPWFFGRYGFVIKNAQPLPFMSYKGKLGFFSVKYKEANNG